MNKKQIYIGLGILLVGGIAIYLYKTSAKKTDDKKGTSNPEQTANIEDKIISVMKDTQKLQAADNVKLKQIDEVKVKTVIKALTEKEKQFTYDYLLSVKNMLSQISKLDKKDSKFQEKSMQIMFTEPSDFKNKWGSDADFVNKTKQKISLIN
jgi:hypothetical protein